MGACDLAVVGLGVVVEVGDDHAGLLQPMVEQTIRGPNWALLTHRDSENTVMARSFTQWLMENPGE